MKIAVVDHFGNAGGGSRVLRALLPAFKSLRPEYKITFFCNAQAVKREGFAQELIEAGVELQTLRSTVLSNFAPFGIRATGKFIQLLQQKYSRHSSMIPYILSGAVHQEVERRCRGYDLAFFPWPYFICCPQLKCPMVGTFHDFNFRYYFSGPTWHPWGLNLLNREIPLWLENSTPVVSTEFMKQELTKFYPRFAEKARVIHLAPMSALSKIEDSEARKTVKDLGVSQSYILYPCHLATHKNIGMLLAAHALLKKRGINILLVLTGQGTDLVKGRSCEIGLEVGMADQDVLGLGYVSNLQMDALIQCAELVISTSLYEAGNGPGLDAWSKGVPVAMSRILPFIEHMQVQDVRAKVFDPMSPQDIADKIESILSNPEAAKKDAQHSQQAIGRFTWERTAAKYLQVFDEACKSGG